MKQYNNKIKYNRQLIIAIRIKLLFKKIKNNQQIQN